MEGGHEAAAPVAWTVHDGCGVVLHHDVGWEIIIEGTERVVDPGTEGGSAAEDAAGVHLADAGAVVDAIGNAASDDGEMIRAGGGVGEPVAQPEA